MLRKKDKRKYVFLLPEENYQITSASDRNLLGLSSDLSVQIHASFKGCYFGDLGVHRNLSTLTSVTELLLRDAELQNKALYIYKQYKAAMQKANLCQGQTIERQV